MAIDDTNSTQPSTNDSQSTPLMSNKVYNILKPITTTILPGLGALYFALSQLWGFPHSTEVVGTIAALNVFLGLVLNASSRTYNQFKYAGDIVISESPEKINAVIAPNRDINPDIEKEVTFKICRE